MSEQKPKETAPKTATAPVVANDDATTRTLSAVASTEIHARLEKMQHTLETDKSSLVLAAVMKFIAEYEQDPARFAADPDIKLLLIFGKDRVRCHEVFNYLR